MFSVPGIPINGSRNRFVLICLFTQNPFRITILLPVGIGDQKTIEIVINEDGQV